MARPPRSQPKGPGLAEAAVYRPRRPQDSTYYQCVEDHFEDFERVYEERFERAYGFYRPYLRSVIYRYLDCGVLRNGFARVRCTECGHGGTCDDGPFHKLSPGNSAHSRVL